MLTAKVNSINSKSQIGTIVRAKRLRSFSDKLFLNWALLTLGDRVILPSKGTYMGLQASSHPLPQPTTCH